MALMVPLMIVPGVNWLMVAARAAFIASYIGPVLATAAMGFLIAM